jgi:MFS family permease
MVSNYKVKVRERGIEAGVADPDESSAPKRSPFRSRDFRWYWFGGLVSNAGTWLQNVSGSVYVLDHTHSTVLVGVLNLATFIPVFLFSVPGGVLADRHDRRMIVTLMSLASIGFGLVVTICSVTGTLNAWTLIAMAFCFGSAYSISKPAMTAMLPAIVPESDIAHATAINTLQFNVGQIGGSSLSALLLAVGSYSWAFGVNTVSFVGPIVAMTMVRPAAELGRKVAAKGGGREGMRFVLRSPVILPILGAVILSNAAGECLRTITPAMSERVLHAPNSTTGIIIAVYSAGATAGVATFGLLSRRVPGYALLVGAFVIQAAGLLGSGLSRTPWLSAVSAFPIGLGLAFNIPILSGGLLRLSPDEFRGRVMSFFNIAMLGLRPLFALTAGGLGSFLSPGIVLIVFMCFPLVALRLAGATYGALQERGLGPEVPGSAPRPAARTSATETS